MGERHKDVHDWAILSEAAQISMGGDGPRDGRGGVVGFLGVKSTPGRTQSSEFSCSPVYSEFGEARLRQNPEPENNAPFVVIDNASR
ncbi:Hypothetical protein SMAX5B_004962 [Scophthalmus maximus]|uniref:Uncharacterized protein n=1 Tax=Scophthalmus maximus TaxID=52904 RepID=A0A2U9BS52_SCOMX|nr:Hypothetical protein SMAX5B_004962 [Scophthalmus maximus]KAF0038019.1 hypothetical protein F2P81_010893 [Scophthalmus maximus]